MQHEHPVWPDPVAFLTQSRPDEPVAFFCPEALRRRVWQFQSGFAGEITYAVKANPHPAILRSLARCGIRAFDVASVPEMQHLRSHVPGARLHYNNPVRSRAEIAAAARLGVRSWSVDQRGELAKLHEHFAKGSADIPPHEARPEIAVRFKLPSGRPAHGAGYDFGEKFGATPEMAAQLLAEVARLGHAPALTFHPGTQCSRAETWAEYVGAAAGIAHAAGVRIRRLNVGGGFPSMRDEGERPPLEKIFGAIEEAARQHFGAERPQLLCEPGRALAADAFTIALRIKAVRADGALYLNDGIYGALAEFLALGAVGRYELRAPDGSMRRGAPGKRIIFGPTCDSLDRLPEPLSLPADLREGDYLLFHGMGAYSLCLSTGFNGYGLRRIERVADLHCA